MKREDLLGRWEKLYRQALEKEVHAMKETRKPIKIKWGDEHSSGEEAFDPEGGDLEGHVVPAAGSDAATEVTKGQGKGQVGKKPPMKPKKRGLPSCAAGSFDV